MIVVGISHKTAPIEIRERAALTPESVSALLGELRGTGHVEEALIVSTCNRVEIFALGADSEADADQRAVSAVESAFLRRARGVDGHTYRYLGTDAVKHLIRVASSLDSLVLGEPQILGQVKAAFEFAQNQGAVGGRLSRVVVHALKAAKRVRSETSIGTGQVSVPSVAIDLAKQIFGTLEGRQTALIGSGQMGEAVAKLLTGAGASLQVVGRNRERIASLAGELGARAVPLDNLSEVLASADIIVTTTSATEFVVKYEEVAAARRKRRGRNLFLIDLAVPRDVDPKVNSLDGVFLYNVDDLSQIVAETVTQRQKEATRAESIVVEETRSYERVISRQQVTPTVVALRQRFGDVFRAEMERSFRSKLKDLDPEERRAVERMVEASLNKLLHAPTRYLRELAVNEESEGVTSEELTECVGTLNRLFDLEREVSLPITELPDALPSSPASAFEVPPRVASK